MKNEKNRTGESVKFDERANEDKYFAIKDHERIEEMKAEFQKAEAARREVQIVNCPKCSGKLANYKFMEFVLDRCENCEGIWLDKGELDAILRSAARGPLGDFFARYFSKDKTEKKP
jgi:Zn-finger nucleic acid-binding protein